MNIDEQLEVLSIRTETLDIPFSKNELGIHLVIKKITMNRPFSESDLIYTERTTIQKASNSGSRSICFIPKNFSQYNYIEFPEGNELRMFATNHCSFQITNFKKGDTINILFKRVPFSAIDVFYPKTGMGAHQSAKMKNDEWLTPPYIIRELGPFDLDPCSPIVRQWPTADKHYTVQDDGLSKEWAGRVWCNPPYGLIASDWLRKLADHGNGIALIFARTETKMFFDHVWSKADALLFLEGRLYFHYVTGESAKANAGAPSVLVAYGTKNAIKLQNCNIAGKFIQLK